MPRVSIVLPTYNRADALARAIASVERQSFGDWELVIVDDGSTDGTAGMLRGLDARVRVVRQANAGVYAARNAGIRAGRSDLVAFLDSDDEWLPQHLELAVGFLDASPNEQMVMAEFWADWGSGRRVLEDRHAIATHWVPMAHAIGSRALNLPQGETDDYLRLFASRETMGEAAVYRAPVLEHYRWGHIGGLPPL